MTLDHIFVVLDVVIAFLVFISTDVGAFLAYQL